MLRPCLRKRHERPRPRPIGLQKIVPRKIVRQKVGRRGIVPRKIARRLAVLRLVNLQKADLPGIARQRANLLQTIRRQVSLRRPGLPKADLRKIVRRKNVLRRKAGQLLPSRLAPPREKIPLVQPKTARRLATLNPVTPQLVTRCSQKRASLRKLLPNQPPSRPLNRLRHRNPPSQRLLRRRNTRADLKADIKSVTNGRS
jgi:hypothetical protein